VDQRRQADRARGRAQERVRHRGDYRAAADALGKLPPTYGDQRALSWIPALFSELVREGQLQKRRREDGSVIKRYSAEQGNDQVEYELVEACALTAAPHRPVLRYHGGKWMLAPWLMSFFPDHRIYCEPFGGGASVLMRKPRSYAEVYNDLDDEIVNVFRVLRDPTQSKELARLIHLTPWSRTEFYAAYEPSEDPLERARRTIARTYMAFGTTSRRANRTGFRAKAYRQHQTGVQDWCNYPDAVASFAERLRGVTIEHRNALLVDCAAGYDRDASLSRSTIPEVDAAVATMGLAERSRLRARTDG
jgi:hypothetical protein